MWQQSTPGGKQLGSGEELELGNSEERRLELAEGRVEVLELGAAWRGTRSWRMARSARRLHQGMLHHQYRYRRGRASHQPGECPLQVGDGDEQTNQFQSELGTLKGTTAKIYMDTAAKPWYFKARPLPYALKDEAEKELERLENEGTMSMHPVWRVFVFFSLCLISITPHCDGGEILVVPMDGSHWVNMKIQLEELHARGHNLTVLRPSISWYIEERSPLYTSITVDMEEDLESFLHLALQKHVKAQRERSSFLTFFTSVKQSLKIIEHYTSVWSDAISRMFDEQTVIKRLIDSKFDVVLTDPVLGSGVILAKYLKLPLVLNVRWITSGDGHFVLAPSPLSYIPAQGSGLTDKMNFVQRVKNIFFHSITLFQQKFIVGPIYDTMCHKYIEGGCDIISLLQEADIWLFRSNFVFDFPRPTMPNVVYIGGFQCKPAQPLSADLEKFVQSAGDNGVIIMTLGTYIHALPKEVAEDIASVFAKMPQKDVWQHKGERPSTLGNNTLMVDWMPQKDLLGHPQTKVFVAHGGTNGVQEAIYHGVPVLGIPLFFDQYDNLLRLQDRGAAKIIQLADVNGHNFEKGIMEVLHQESYKQNMQRLSRLHRDQPMSPMDQAIFWVEYVMRHKGASHLHTESYKMPWYSYYCLDVLLLLVTAVVVLFISFVAIFRFLCCTTRRKAKTKQNCQK
ncbi:LOW QUALITY PROTEIN: UDP-glucuronosyltransferase 2C1-like [Pholidichthys leucotaenia]